MKLNQDFKDFVGFFIEHDVRFMIVGGYAVAAHGHPRYTKDLDVWVLADVSNSDRIDILTSATGLDFDAAFTRRVFISVDDVQVPFISVEDLRLNKIATGRLQDLADAEALKGA